MTVRVFLLCLAAGLCCGIVEGGLSPFRRKFGLVLAIPTDIAIALCSVLLHMLIMYFFTRGQFFPYAVLAQALGFILAHTVSKKAALRLENSGKKFRKKATKRLPEST